jgi:hypothetical protein
LQAIEGTEVALHASANVEIKRSSPEIDLGCTGRQGLRMTAEGRTATGQLTLRLDPRDVSRPEYDSYQLRFADVDGRENEHPIRHRIEVIRDLPPDVQVVQPQQPDVQVPLGGKLSIKTLAEDPDFGLRQVRLRLQHEDGRNLRIVPLLEKPKPEKVWQGPFSKSYVFEPAGLGLKAGDRVQYSVEAEDNKEPAPGLTATRKQWITVVGPEQRQSQKPEAGQGEHSPTGGDKADSGGRGKPSGNKAGGAQGEPSKDEKGNAADKKPQPGKTGENQQQKSSEQSRGAEQADQSKSGQGEGKQGASSSGQRQQGQASANKASSPASNRSPKPTIRRSGSTPRPIRAMPWRKSSRIARSRNNLPPSPRKRIVSSRRNPPTINSSPANSSPASNSLDNNSRGNRRAKNRAGRSRAREMPAAKSPAARRRKTPSPRTRNRRARNPTSSNPAARKRKSPNLRP